MARPFRLSFAGGVYHITARGTERPAIARDDTERAYFVETLAAMVERYRVRCQAWVLMDDHDHLLLPPDPESVPRVAALGRRALAGDGAADGCQVQRREPTGQCGRTAASGGSALGGAAREAVRWQSQDLTPSLPRTEIEPAW
jgi:hypothetical protein